MFEATQLEVTTIVLTNEDGDSIAFVVENAPEDDDELDNLIVALYNAENAEAPVAGYETLADMHNVHVETTCVVKFVR